MCFSPYTFKLYVLVPMQAIFCVNPCHLLPSNSINSRFSKIAAKMKPPKKFVKNHHKSNELFKIFGGCTTARKFLAILHCLFQLVAVLENLELIELLVN